jgi:hypothetical protein
MKGPIFSKTALRRQMKSSVRRMRGIFRNEIMGCLAGALDVGAALVQLLPNLRRLNSRARCLLSAFFHRDSRGIEQADT